MTKPLQYRYESCYFKQVAEKDLLEEFLTRFTTVMKPALKNFIRAGSADRRVDQGISEVEQRRLVDQIMGIFKG